MKFELLLMDAEHREIIATGDGQDGIDAAQRYANEHAGVRVYAFRSLEAPPPVAIAPTLGGQIIEPGHRGWGKNSEYRRRYEAMKAEAAE